MYSWRWYSLFLLKLITRESIRFRYPVHNLCILLPAFLAAYSNWNGCTWGINSILPTTHIGKHKWIKAIQKQVFRSLALSHQKKAGLAAVQPSLLLVWDHGHQLLYYCLLVGLVLQEFYIWCHIRRRLDWAGACQDLFWYGNEKYLKPCFYVLQLI